MYIHHHHPQSTKIVCITSATGLSDETLPIILVTSRVEVNVSGDAAVGLFVIETSVQWMECILQLVLEVKNTQTEHNNQQLGVR